jgi:hypothetical protein
VGAFITISGALIGVLVLGWVLIRRGATHDEGAQPYNYRDREGIVGTLGTIEKNGYGAKGDFSDM